MTKAQQPEPPAPDMRARFEAFFTESRKSRGKDKRPTFHRLPDDTYSDDHTQRHWWTWQCAQAAVLADRESLLSNMDHAVLRMPLEAAMSGALAQHQFYSRVQSLLDRIGGKHETRKVVAWRYMPSPTWGEHVITQDPKVAEVEELTVGATPKMEDKTP